MSTFSLCKLSMWNHYWEGVFLVWASSRLEQLNLLKWQPQRWTMTGPQYKTPNWNMGGSTYYMNFGDIWRFRPLQNHQYCHCAQQLSCGVSCCTKTNIKTLCVAFLPVLLTGTKCKNRWFKWSWSWIRAERPNESWFQLYPTIVLLGCGTNKYMDSLCIQLT